MPQLILCIPATFYQTQILSNYAHQSVKRWFSTNHWFVTMPIKAWRDDFQRIIDSYDTNLKERLSNSNKTIFLENLRKIWVQ